MAAVMTSSAAFSAAPVTRAPTPSRLVRGFRGSRSTPLSSDNGAAYTPAAPGMHSRSMRWNCATVSAATCKAGAVMAVDAVEVEAIKQDLSALLEGKDQGLFGIKSEVKSKIHELVERLESMNPQPAPLEDVSCVAGEWRVLYSTIKITGSKRTKLGLREFVKISDMVQIIDPVANTAINEVRFNVMGLGSISGALTITATYEPVSDSRVAIKFESSVLEPSALQKIFEKNYDVLLGIFNPEGWLDITYVDDTYRVGRDDKGNVFILQRP